MAEKFLSKLIQSLPSWEMTKYYGRVAWFQLQCLKYRIQTSEMWFNFMNKYMPGKLKTETEYEEKVSSKTKTVGSKSASKNDTSTEKRENTKKTTKKNVQAGTTHCIKAGGSTKNRKESKSEEE